jgi:histidine triad (HIT) family protein
MPEETIFSKIVRREVPADILFQDDRVTAFRDINAQAPIHILIVPNKPIPSVNEVSVEDEGVIGHLFVVAARLAEEQGIAADGYRLIVNTGRHAGQEVYHLHMHLLGGRALGPMLTRRT